MLSQAMDLFHMFLEDREKVHPDLRGVVFSLAGHAGDETTYRQLWELENRAALQEEKMRLLLGLSRFSQPELLTEDPGAVFDLGRAVPGHYQRGDCGGSQREGPGTWPGSSSRTTGPSSTGGTAAAVSG